MRTIIHLRNWIYVLITCICFVGCGGGGGSTPATTTSSSSLSQTGGASSYTISGTVTGLAAGAQLVLNNNATDVLTINANGIFTFSNPVTTGSYAVTVATLPTGENCSVANYHGSGISSNVTNVNVTCAPSGYTVAGSVSGLLAGQQMTLINNGSDTLTISGNGTFSFATAVPYNGSYVVTIGTQPSAQFCTVANATGAGVTANVASVQVICSANNFPVSGTISGLAPGTQLAIENNGGNLLTIGANGPFSFNQGVAANGSYSVTVLTQPQNQTCTVSNGFGAGVLSAISSVKITCVANNSTYTIGGVVRGLNTGAQLTLQNNGTDALTLNANGGFTFATPVSLNGAYSVTLGTQPIGQTCSINNFAGSGVVANINSVQVICSNNSYTVGGTVSGLPPGTQLFLYNNNSGGLMISSNGPFTFTDPVAYGGSYAVTVGTKPAGQTCSATNGTGANVVSNIKSIQIICSPSSYLVGGSVVGLAPGTQVTLLDNGTDAVTVNANTTFSFPKKIAYQGSFTVTIGTQPVGQVCQVYPSTTVTGMSYDVNSISVNCNTGNYAIGGTVTGLSAGSKITLQNNNDTLTVNGNGNFTFATAVAAHGAYNVSATASSGQACTVNNGSGANVISAVNNVAVTCNTLPAIGYAYILDTSNNMVRQFNVTSNGLAPTANSVGTDLNPCGIARHPSGKYIYVGNSGSSTISQYSVGAGGLLAPMNPVHVQAGAGICGITIDPAGQFAYAVVSATNQAGVSAQRISVNVFSIGTDGTLTAQPTLGLNSIYSAYGLPGTSITLTPNAQYAYLLLPGSTSLYQYAISAGTMTPLNPLLSAANSDLSYYSFAFSVNPQGTYAYYAGSYNNVARYSIGHNGTLSLLTDVVSGSGAPYPRSVAYSPSGNYAYLMDSGDVRQFSVGADGTFTPLNPSTLNVASAYPLVFDATGQYVFAVLSAGVGQYALGSDGALSLLPTLPLNFSFTPAQMITIHL